MNFALSNKKAKKFELLVLDFLRECKFDPQLNEEKTNYSFYDIIIAEPKLTFEVKADFRSSVSGNIAIEYHNCKQDKPSGIMVSTADYWCHCIYEDKIPTIYMANRLDLLDFIEVTEPFKKIIAGGDDNANLYLYKKHVIMGEYNSDKPLQKMNPSQFMERLNAVV